MYENDDWAMLWIASVLAWALAMAVLAVHLGLVLRDGWRARRRRLP